MIIPDYMTDPSLKDLFKVEFKMMPHADPSKQRKTSVQRRIYKRANYSSSQYFARLKVQQVFFV